MAVMTTERTQPRETPPSSRLPKYIEASPLVTLEHHLAGATLLGKYEAAQKGGSFKSRGAYLAVDHYAKLGAKEITTASAGNHAIGVAMAARALDLWALVYVPESTAPERIERIQEFGGAHVEVKYGGESVDECLVRARHSDLPMVEPFNSPLTIAGQSTVGYEILRQSDKPVNKIFVPAGGGGLAAGTLLATEGTDIEVVLAQYGGNNSAENSVRAGELRAADSVDKTAAGSAVRLIGSECLKIMMRNRHRLSFMTVNAAEVGERLFHESNIRQEQSTAMGAAAFDHFPEVTGMLAETAAIKYARESDRSFDRETWVAIVSGSNVDEAAERKVIQAYHDHELNKGSLALRQCYISRLHSQ